MKQTGRYTLCEHVCMSWLLVHVFSKGHGKLDRHREEVWPKNSRKCLWTANMRSCFRMDLGMKLVTDIKTRGPLYSMYVLYNCVHNTMSSHTGWPNIYFLSASLFAQWERSCSLRFPPNLVHEKQGWDFNVYSMASLGSPFGNCMVE